MFCFTVIKAKKNPLKSGFIEFEIKNQVEIKKNLPDLMLFE